MSSRNLIYIWILGFFLNLPLLSYGQEQNTYIGTLEVGKYIGDTNYDYKVINNDTILNGIFQFQSSDLHTLLDTKDSSFIIRGNFENNHPVGAWVFRFNSFQSDGKSRVEDYQYVVKVSGEQSIAEGNLNQGKPDGTWICSVQNIKDSEIDRVTFRSIIDFDNGIPQRNFRIEDEQQELIGRFLRNGLAHDEWTLYSDDEIGEAETWKFNEGILERVLLHSDDKVHSIEVYPNVKGQTKTITIDKTYLEILKLKLKSEEASKVSSSGILNLLSNNNQYYRRIDMILSKLGTAEFSPQFKVRVPYDPIMVSESKHLDSIQYWYRKSKEISSSLLEDTQVALLKLSNEKVNKLEASVGLVFERILIPIEQIIQARNQGVLPYISRDELVEKTWPEGIPIMNRMDDDPLISYSKEKNANTLKSVEKLSEEVFNYLDTVQKIITDKVSQQKREQEAIELEKRMITQLQYLEVLQKSIETDTIPEVYRKTLGKIKENTSEKLNTYVAIQDVDEKLEYARELVGCFETLDKIGETIVKLPKQQNEIQQAYDDAVWNPFTATIMVENIKKRITQAYSKVLIPFFLQKVEQDLSCKDATKWVEMVEATYSRMLEMREENTKKVERKLRKEKDPLIILQRFRVYPSNKEPQ